ncbi:hypothetical protein BDDG_13108, partial [Blastomyces dermatitidis ATCC 18188]
LITSISQLCDLFLIQLVFCVHSYKETFTILHHSFTNFSYSSIIIFIIVIIKHHHLIQDFYSFLCLTLFICLSIILYMFLIMISHSHNKHSYSVHTRQFISKSSYIDRFTFTDNYNLNVKSLIKNLKNTIIKKLSVLYVTESSVSLSASSTASSPAVLSQSSTLASVSDSPTSAISVPVTLTSVTPGFIISAFITSSSHFKEMLYRLDELYFSRITLSLNSIEII